MDEKIDWRYMLNDRRARVYLLWAVLVTIGFALTQYNQVRQINGLWLIIATIGLSYMFMVMPLRIKKLRNIYFAWLIPIVFGMLISFLAFYSSQLAGLVQYLGGFWLVVLAAGYFLNGLADAPSTWYFIAAVMNAAAGLAIFNFNRVALIQYNLAAVVTAWSMLNLWLFRVD